jgi:hypothetical protein
MLDQLPPPSKRSFGFPLPTRALEYFTHPGGTTKVEAFREPFSHHGTVYACNGHLAIMAERYDGLPGAERPEAFERVRGLFPAHGGRHADYVTEMEKRGLIPDRKDEWERRWRPFDDCALALWKRGPLAPFDFVRGRWRIRLDPIVRVGAAALAPLPLLQLLARLPRSAVWVDNRADGPVLCRFNGGLAVLAPCYGPIPPAPAFSILAPRQDTLSQAHVF